MSITSVTDNVAPVVGLLTNGAYTNDPDPTVQVSLSGTGALAGNTLQLYNGTGTGSPLGSSYTLTSTDISNGFANVQPGTLTNGTTYTLTARMTDAADNQSAVSSFTLTEDTTPPTLTPVANQTHEATGPGGAAAAFSATVTDIVDGTDSVMFTDGSTVVHSGDTFGLGTHIITASATDAAGNTASETFTITVQDTTPPDTSMVTKPSALTNSNNATFAVSGTDAVGIAGFLYKIDNAANWTSTTSTAISFTGLPEGNHTFQVAAFDAAGNVDATPASYTWTVDTTPPTVLSDVTSPAIGDFNTGTTITLKLTLSESVTVTGTPILTLNDGGTARYQSGSGSNVLTFTYVVANVQNTSALAVTGNNLNGSTITITDAAGNVADLSGANVTFTGLAIGATVKSITASPPSGDLRTGKVVTFTATMSEPVTVSGAPFLVLNDGGKAAYKSGSGTNTLTFTYTVAAGQNTSALAVMAYSPNGSTVYVAGNKAATADLSGVTAFTAGSQIDTRAPVVSSVVADPATADLNAGSVTLMVSFSENVFVNPTKGSPTLSLNDGGVATYAGGSANTLTFTYTVAAGQNTADLTVTGLVLHGATIQDGAGNNAVLSGAVTNPPGILQIDTAAPTIKSVVARSPSR